MRRLTMITAAALALAGCTAGHPQSEPTPAAPADAPVTSATWGIGTDCNGIADADVARATGTALFAKVLVNDVGCFWQENTVTGTFGAGMGISTWRYRGSDIAAERELEQQSGRTLAELSIQGNKGFKAYDANTCSIYVAKGQDLITWSIQTMNPSTLPPLCAITDQLAELSQDRVN
ncbi:DUF3558 domain-containing protein [Mycolicibacterium diernhoferi]|uniref:LprB protein n=2 Tax=Mycolicibacterium diernhoferi TaxID=1801 RepID=A0A1Q4HEK1_9MYCO|nr:DUF3558 domain-containing protein [Mycolicibacterium diernhoferi]OJZ65915.1 lprB protein [Mycolicibacterium diernhoferi]OPE54334.1 lprB protein [Mycolicibacterium diernhoferi]QYL23823.1 DUF3558 domain-containing protein [Mycolicibacterium diernhoferi]